jgi:hypothetical protein
MPTTPPPRWRRASATGLPTADTVRSSIADQQRLRHDDDSHSDGDSGYDRDREHSSRRSQFDDLV